MNTNKWELIKLPEPTLLFGYNQALEDPRDGLTLFSPLDKGKIYGIRAGVIGKRESIERYKRWVAEIQKPIIDVDSKSNLVKDHRPMFPGFETAFRIAWSPEPIIEIEIDPSEIDKTVYLADPYQRVYQTVEIFSKKILEAHKQEEEKPDIWFVVIPEEIWKYCRPQSKVESNLRVTSTTKMSKSRAKKLQKEPSLFNEEQEDIIPYQFELNFHNQLKARILEKGILTQILRETTIAPNDFLNQFGKPKRKVDDPSTLAWNISTAVYYKVGGRPWKINGIREGVCYIGLVYKRDETHADERMACCAAQMFLEDGDGVVFKGNVGPWYNPVIGDYHLSENDAEKLIAQAIKAYKSKKGGKPPQQLFIHGKVVFNDEEWRGFLKGIDVHKTNLIGVRIRPENNFKLFRKQTRPILRGTAYIRLDRVAYLWTKGYTPRLQTYTGRAVPNPLLIDVCRGDINIRTVLSDILALTKLNYNTCIFADGEPVTLKFADAVGEILTAGPLSDLPPLPFRHYI